MIVVDKNGLQGTLAHEDALSNDSESRLLVLFQNGKQVLVPRELLTLHEDGRYHLAVSIEELLADQERLRGDTLHRTSNDAAGYAAGDDTEELSVVIPVTEERVTVRTRSVEKGRVEIRKTVHEHTEVVDQPLHAEEVEIERVAINRFIEEAVPVRHEGDTLIIPLLEEVLVIEKRLLLREEVHIRKLRKEVHDPQEVLLRDEQVEILRKPGSNPGHRQEEAQKK